MDDVQKRSPGSAAAVRIVNSIKMLEKQELRRRVKRELPPILLPRQQGLDGGPISMVAKRLNITDAIFPTQWHYVNDQYPQHVMNVTGLWEMGITGKGVISAMVDDGLDYESEDLADNFDAAGSYDFNDHVPLPKPILWDDHHGTRCAGEIAAVKNEACGIGIAYESKVAGLRILSGPISDVDEAAALNYGYQTTSIYSCSWGPPDDGRSMAGPSLLIQKAVLNGINKGRSGKGSVFVFAAGNGAASGDQCNFDGYTNSIYSVTVAAVDYKGLHPYYSEACAANMVSTYSSGSGEHVHTTDVGKNKCSSSHGGTSAAAPQAVGVFALALSVRPELTWRDIQYLCVQTARMINPQDPDWEDTSIGRKYSYKYGFGVLDAFTYVNAAKEWKLVKPQAWAFTDIIKLPGVVTNETSGEMTGGEPITATGISNTQTVTKAFLEQHNLDRIEHINVKVWITHAKRGDVEVELVSPTGVKSILAGKRANDLDKKGFPGWVFMTVKHWGESGVGDWTLRVNDQGNANMTGNFQGWALSFWGESIDPSNTELYQLPDIPSTTTPQQTSTSMITSTKTKVLTKPTNHLPDDHGTAEGEAHKPTFPQDDTAGASSSISPTVDEGYFTHITDLLKSTTWLFGALAIVVLFVGGIGFFFWRRRSRRRSAGDYTVVPGDSVGMSTLERGNPSSRGGRSKELYDAFGEVSDDEVDEGAALVGTRPEGFHSGFLRDEEEGVNKPYRDHPEETDERDKGTSGRLSPQRQGSEGEDSASGSWVDTEKVR